jgi:hypothetical protein
MDPRLREDDRQAVAFPKFFTEIMYSRLRSLEAGKL